MMISVSVKPNAHENRVEELPDGSFSVWVTAVPEKGKANLAVLRALAAHFGVALSRVKIVRGASSGRKLVEIS